MLPKQARNKETNISVFLEQNSVQSIYLQRDFPLSLKICTVCSSVVLI